MILTHGCRILFLLVATRQVKGNCNDKLGMEDGRISDRHITASSSHNTPNCEAQLARLNDPVNHHAWCPLTSNTNEWIQVYLRESKQVTGIMIQGRNNMDQWVTKFKVLYSDDGTTWKHIRTGDDREDKVFPGNTDKHTVVTAIFPRSITTTYIRINPVNWHSHPSLRFEVLGCTAACRNHQYTRIENKRLQNHEIQTKTSRNYLICERACSSDTSCKSFNWNQSTRSCQTNDATSGAHLTDFVDSSNWVYHQVDDTVDDIKCDSSLCPAGKTCRNQCTMSGMKTICSVCMEPMGMENDKIKDSQITASDEFESGIYPAWTKEGARLNHNTAWATHELDGKQWIQILVDEQQYLSGVMTQGKGNGWVTHYAVEFTKDGVTWDYVSDIHGTAKKIFKGNTDGNTVVTNLFPRAITASCLRIRPTAWRGAIHLRMELLGCLHP